jgi:hypothetical protein
VYITAASVAAGVVPASTTPFFAIRLRISSTFSGSLLALHHCAEPATSTPLLTPTRSERGAGVRLRAVEEIAPGLWHWTARHDQINMDVSSYYG